VKNYTLNVNEAVFLKTVLRLNTMLENRDFVIDKSGVKMVELIAPSLKFNPFYGRSINLFDIKKTNLEYVDLELQWYKSQNLSINPNMSHIKIWNEVATKDDQQLINSNYGWCIFSEENGNQYKNCVNELLCNKESRRAVMLYTRPSMWKDWNKNGMNDFMCTDGVQCFIRNNTLIYVVKQRSCDFVFGLFNDYAWHHYVFTKLFNDLEFFYPDLKIENSEMLYFPFSLHIYERHFPVITKIANAYYDDGIEKVSEEIASIRNDK